MAYRKTQHESIAGKLRLWDNPDASWRKYGEEEPYFGVLTDDKFRKKNLTEDSLREFFESGEQHVSSILMTLQEHAISPRESGDALDFGCGVGRIVIPLARRFGQVTGVDISEAYRAEAMKNCMRHNVGNARFVESVGPLIEEGARFDFVHSSIVFNHIPWVRGKIIITEMFGMIRPGGVMAVQVMLQCYTSRLRRLGGALRRNLLPFNWLVNLARGRPVFEPLMQGNEYPIRELLLLLKNEGAGNFYIRLDTIPKGHTFAFLCCEKKQR